MSRALLAVEIGTAIPAWLAGASPLRIAALSLLAVALAAGGILAAWVWRDTHPTEARNDARIRRNVAAWRRAHLPRAS